VTRGRPRTRPVTPQQALQFAGKAEEFLLTAEQALAERWYSPAAGNAVHAGINACDAILGLRIGERAAAQACERARALVELAQRIVAERYGGDPGR
jgi:hypothetical protein